MSELTFGNLDGSTEWRLELLRELFDRLTRTEFGGPALELESPEISYDKESDFHFLTFTYNGHVFAVRFYKVWSYSRDGIDQAVGVPRNEIISFSCRVKKQALHGAAA